MTAVMTAPDFKASLLRLFFQTKPATANATFHNEVAVAVNAAFQEIWTAPILTEGRPFNQSQHTFETQPGQPGYQLATGIMRVVGHVQVGGRPMEEVLNRGVFNRLSDFSGASSITGKPTHYFISNENAGDLKADALRSEMHFFPHPIGTETCTFWAEVEPPSFTACDLDNSATVLPIPHQYIESVLIPIARFRLGASPWLKLDAAQQEQLEQAYFTAMRTIGLSTAVSAAKRKAKAKTEAAA
ncbi:MAG: hypothetical protein AAGJ83_11350 [Planctomycetota bacterium]